MGIISVKIVFESHFLIVMSPSCGLNSCLAVKNLNIHDKSTSMSSDYGTNEYIQCFRYQCQYPIYSQVSSRGSIRHKAQFDQCKIHLRVSTLSLLHHFIYSKRQQEVELCQPQKLELEWNVHWMSDVKIGHIQMFVVFPAKVSVAGI